MRKSEAERGIESLKEKGLLRGWRKERGERETGCVREKQKDG